MNRYETVFIMTPVLSADQVAETVEKYKAYLKENNAKIVHEESWGCENWLTRSKRNQLVSTSFWNSKPMHL